MPAPASAPDGPGRPLSMVGVPAGASGAQVAHDVIEAILAGPGAGAQAAYALVTDPESATPVLQPDEPLEDPRTALVILTSGSTGDPKGVCWSRENLLAMSAMWRHRYPDLIDAPRVVALPVTTAGGLGVIVRAVVDAAPIVAVPSIGGASRFTSQGFADAIAPVADAGPVVSLVPTQVALLLGDDIGRSALRAMRRVFLGGAAAPARLVAQARGLGIDIVTTYGMTETCGGCVHDGEPLDGVSIRVDDGGRIHLSGAMCALGYRGRPQDTERHFAGDTFATGDVGAWDGHRLTVLGRIDDIVQVRGVNVATGAVERAIVDSGLALEAVVLPVPDDVDGHRLHALVVPDRAATAQAGTTWSQAVEDAVRDRLGAVAVPRSLRPVSVLPYLPGGKIDRRAARALLGTDSADPDAADSDAPDSNEGT